MDAFDEGVGRDQRRRAIEVGAVVREVGPTQLDGERPNAGRLVLGQPSSSMAAMVSTRRFVEKGFVR